MDHIEAACLQRQRFSGQQQQQQQQQRPLNSHKDRRRQPGANNAIDSNSDDSCQGNDTVTSITPTVNGGHARRFMVDTGASRTVVVQET
jgi:predicted aspartyl protease